jgi:5-methylcytosine-specific restriction protein A
MRITKNQFIAALNDPKIGTTSNLNLLGLICSQTKHEATANQIAHLLGRNKPGSVNIQFGKIGHIIGDKFGVTPSIRKDGPFKETPRWYEVLSTIREEKTGWIWTLHPELVQALEQINSNDEFKSADELPLKEDLQEGLKKTIVVNAYERNKKARNECINYHKAVCSVCEFDFEFKYGAIGIGYIHVHHTTPISHVGKNYIISPIKDLIPVCPNCHSMIHTRKKPLLY